MKRTLILTSLFSGDLTEYTNETVKLIQGKGKVSVFSPVFLSLGEKRKEFFMNLLAVSKALGEDTLPFVGSEDHQIILGRLRKDVHVDNIVVVNEVLVSTQESYYDNHIGHKLKDMPEFYKSEDAEKQVNTIEEAIEYILGE